MTRNVAKIAAFIAVAGAIVIAAWQINSCRSETTFAPNAHQWPRERIPLAVSIGQGIPLRDVDVAIQHVSRAAGCDVLRRRGGSTADVVIEFVGIEVGDDESHGAEAYYRRDIEGRVTGYIAVRRPTNTTPTLMHEFGHVLGLAHDDFESSAMHIGTGGRDALPLPRFTDADREALRERYCAN